MVALITVANSPLVTSFRPADGSVVVICVCMYPTPGKKDASAYYSTYSEMHPLANPNRPLLQQRPRSLFPMRGGCRHWKLLQSERRLGRSVGVPSGRCRPRPHLQLLQLRWYGCKPLFPPPQA